MTLEAADSLAEVGLFYDQLASDQRRPARICVRKSRKLWSNSKSKPHRLTDPASCWEGYRAVNTRAYLGVIARAFDKGYDVAVILTKGTKSLAEQTLRRVKKDFGEFIAADQIEVFDILAVPELTRL